MSGQDLRQESKAGDDSALARLFQCTIINAFDCYKVPLIISAGCDNYVAPLSSVNLSTCIQHTMEMFESIGWIALGFVPTLVAMEAAWKIGKRSLAVAEAVIR